MKTKRLLITGVTGLVGRHLVEKLSQLNFDVYGVSRQRKLDVKGLSGFVSVPDFTNKQHWEDVFSELPPIDIVIHLAGELTFFGKQKSLRASNTIASQVLFEVSSKVGVSKFIYASSVEAIKFSYQNTLLRRFWRRNLSSYGRSKHETEKKLQALSEQKNYNTNLSIIRIGSVFSIESPGFIGLFIEGLLFESRFGAQFNILSDRSILAISTDDLNDIIVHECDLGYGMERGVAVIDAFYPPMSVEGLFLFTAETLGVPHVPRSSTPKVIVLVMTGLMFAAAVIRSSFGDFAAYLLASRFPFNQDREVFPRSQKNPVSLSENKRDERIRAAIKAYSEHNEVFARVIAAAQKA